VTHVQTYLFGWHVDVVSGFSPALPAAPQCTLQVLVEYWNNWRCQVLAAGAVCRKTRKNLMKNRFIGQRSVTCMWSAQLIGCDKKHTIWEGGLGGPTIYLRWRCFHILVK
jgi:hypothetical protein